MARYSVAPPSPRTGALVRCWRGIAFAILPALLAACSFSAPTDAPTPRATETLVNEAKAFEGYTLYAPLRSGLVYLIDNQGAIIHEWALEPGLVLAKLLDNGNLLATNNKEYDPDGNLVWDYAIPQHHDLLKMPNGNALILSRTSISREEAIAQGANPDYLECPALLGPRIVEVRPTGPRDGEIVWEWSVFDHLIQDFDPEQANYGVVEEHPELVDVNFALDTNPPCAEGRVSGAVWLHANALDYNAELDQIMLTIRRFSEIWIIDHSASRGEAAGHIGGNGGKGGDLLYRWGNPRAYRGGWWFHQRLVRPHAAHWIPTGLPGAGNVLLFNNGDELNERLERAYSSVDEIALPSDGYNYRLTPDAYRPGVPAYGPDEYVWTYVADPPESFYSAAMSGAQRLPNGNTLIANSRGMRMFEVSATGETVWEFAIDSELYRSYRYAPDHPGVKALLAHEQTSRGPSSNE